MVYIREAEWNDLPGILDIYNEAIRNLTATFDLYEQSLEARKKWFEKYGDRYPLLVAIVDDRVAGYCSLSPFAEKPAYASSTELTLYIDSEYRGRGIGNALMSEMLARAKSLGYHTVVSRIVGGNEVSMKLHEKHGFTWVGCFKEIGYKFGSWLDVHCYQRMLVD